MARKQRGFAPPEYDLKDDLEKLSKKRPKRMENRLVIVPSLMFLGRRQPEDLMDDGVSYRNPHEFLEFVFPDSAPMGVYPIASEPVYGFTCGDQADVRYLDLEAMFKSAVEVHYDELGFDEPGHRPSTRSAFSTSIRSWALESLFWLDSRALRDT